MARTLSQRTTLETLRRDAKRWLKAVRAGDAQALMRLRAAWPDAPPVTGLRDIQHALAHEYGCEHWIALAGAVTDLALANNFPTLLVRVSSPPPSAVMSTRTNDDSGSIRAVRAQRAAR